MASVLFHWFPAATCLLRCGGNLRLPRRGRLIIAPTSPAYTPLSAQPTSPLLGETKTNAPKSSPEKGNVSFADKGVTQEGYSNVALRHLYRPSGDFTQPFGLNFTLRSKISPAGGFHCFRCECQRNRKSRRTQRPAAWSYEITPLPLPEEHEWTERYASSRCRCR